MRNQNCQWKKWLTLTVESDAVQRTDRLQRIRIETPYALVWLQELDRDTSSFGNVRHLLSWL